MTASPPPSSQEALSAPLSGVNFVKLTGPAGDWIVIYETTGALELTAEHIQWLCDRHRGVGATGLVVTTPDKDDHETTVHRLDAWDQNGQPSRSLTEPARAATAALAMLEQISITDTSHHVFTTSHGLVTTVYTPAYIGVDIGQWSYTDPETANDVGSDVLVMAAGLTDPRPGLSVQLQHNHVTIAVETAEELAAIDLGEPPSIEPAPTQPTSVSFIVPQDPLIDQGMGQVLFRHVPDIQHHIDLAAATTASTIAFQTWSGLEAMNIWRVTTPQGDVVVQLHEGHRVSTFMTLTGVFFGQL